MILCFKLKNHLIKLKLYSKSLNIIFNLKKYCQTFPKPSRTSFFNVSILIQIMSK
eukprot:UN22789